MIYRTDGEGSKVYQPLDWKLFTMDRRRIPANSEERLKEYLKSHPDEDFWLVPGPFINREIQGIGAGGLEENEEHVRCGIVRFDSRAQKFGARDRMKVEYSAKVKRSDAWLGLLQEATARLEEVLGPSAPWIIAAWDQEENGTGRVVFKLCIRDWTGEVCSSFTPELLRSYAQDRYPWRRLWGDLLELRSHRQLEEVAVASGAQAD
jgi:hypothetical protein